MANHPTGADGVKIAVHRKGRASLDFFWAAAQWRRWALMMISKSIIPSIILTLLLTTALYAKCPLKQYEVNGNVIEIKSGKPVPNARILIFFDDYEYTKFNFWPGYKDSFQTDIKGVFKGDCWFFTGTSSDLLFGCSKKPKLITVIIFCDGYDSKRVLFKTKNLAVTEQQGVSIIELSIIEMRKTKQDQE